MVRLIERLVDTDIKAVLLMLLHNDPNIDATLEELATRISRDPREIKKDVEEFVRLGLLKESRRYQLNAEKDREIQNAISAHLTEEARPWESEVSEYKLSTGIDFLDEILSGGIPPSSTILLMGDPGSGREILIYQMIIEVLISGKKVTYIAFDDFPNRIRETFAKLGFDTGSYEGDERLLFVDYYSKLAGLESREKYSGDPSNLVDQAITITRLLPEEGGLLVLDSATTLFQNVGVKSSIELLRRLIARSRRSELTCLVSLTRGAFHPAIVAATQDLADGVVEMKVEEAGGVHRNQLRVVKMKYVKYDPSWVYYKYSPDSGLRRARP